MKNFKLILVLFISLCSKNALSCIDDPDHDFLETLVFENVRSTQITALIKTVSVEKYKDFRTTEDQKRGGNGRIAYKFTANVKQVYKGQLENQFEYYLTYEVGLVPKVGKGDVVINLCQSVDGRYHMPGNAYRISADDSVIYLVKRALESPSDSKQRNACSLINSPQFIVNNPVSVP